MESAILLLFMQVSAAHLMLLNDFTHRGHSSHHSMKRWSPFGAILTVRILDIANLFVVPVRHRYNEIQLCHVGTDCLLLHGCHFLLCGKDLNIAHLLVPQRNLVSASGIYSWHPIAWDCKTTEKLCVHFVNISRATSHVFHPLQKTCHR